jgi:hypothetical protein
MFSIMNNKILKLLSMHACISSMDSRSFSVVRVSRAFSAPDRAAASCFRKASCSINRCLSSLRSSAVTTTVVSHRDEQDKAKLLGACVRNTSPPHAVFVRGRNTHVIGKALLYIFRALFCTHSFPLITISVHIHVGTRTHACKHGNILNAVISAYQSVGAAPEISNDCWSERCCRRSRDC